MDPLFSDPALARFYDLDNGWSVDAAFCFGLAEGSASVLDLGCGTGLLAAALAGNGVEKVVGVDPARAMLDIARSRPGGEGVRWIEADACTVRLGETFDLVLMTGHAFQVFLTAEDQQAVLRTIKAHLAPGGRFIFDSRNPRAREWLEWTPERSERLLHHPELGPVRAWNDVEHDEATGIVTYTTAYAMTDRQILTARSRIAFPAQEDIAGMIERAGLEAHTWLGGWTGTPFTATSPEIIPLGGLPNGGRAPQIASGSS